MQEWANPRYRELVEALNQANDERRAAEIPARGFVIPAPDEN
ncbi:hypothetical protein [Streptomyces montanisoli]|nr:hypothetical protein [Streptomyces montanisoli]